MTQRYYRNSQVKELEGQLAEARVALETAPQPQQQPSTLANDDSAQQADASSAASDMVSDHDACTANSSSRRC